MELGLTPSTAEGEGEGGAYEDHRWRCITLSPYGRHWEGVVQGIVERLCSRSTGEGKGAQACFLSPSCLPQTPNPGLLSQRITN